MAIANIKRALLFTIIMVSLNGIDSQSKMSVIGVAEILTLLENITDTSQTTCASHLASVVKNQDALIGIANEQLQTADTQSKIATMLNRSVSAQTQMSDTLNQIADTMNRGFDIQHRMESTLDKIADTQTMMAISLSQVVNLLQMQTQQIKNVTDLIMNLDGQMDTEIVLPPPILRDCSDLASNGPYESGSYTIQSWDDLGSFPVYCDMDTDDGGWTVIQRRFNGSVDFYRGWDAYEEGFGSPDGEHWLGLSQIRRLTQQGNWTLRIDLEDYQRNTAYAEYSSFSVGDAASYYRLSIGAYNGTAGDSLTHHNNQSFTTKDSDHDAYDWVDNNCAQNRQGAWWYVHCGFSNLNGLYGGGPNTQNQNGITWAVWKNDWAAMKRSQMKMRPVI